MAKPLSPSEVYEQIRDKSDTIRNSQQRGVRAKWRTEKKLSSLCATCKYAQVLRRHGSYDPQVYCQEYMMWVPPDIEECSEHAYVTDLSLMEMAQMAKLVEPPRDTGGHYL